MIEHDFYVKTHWEGGRNATGQISADHLNHEFSIPSELNGRGVGTNPDELLISAASGCITISLAATLERARLTFSKLIVNSKGTASLKDGLFKMEKIVHEPFIYVKTPSQKEKIENKIDRLIKISDQNCMVSNSLRHNVKILIYPQVILE